MRWRRRLFVAAALATGCADRGCGQSAPVGAAGTVTLVYSGNVDGEIEPCG